MPSKILVTPAANSLSTEPYYIEVYDFEVIIPRHHGLEFIQIDGPLPEDAAAGVLATGKVGADVKEFFLSKGNGRCALPTFWRVRLAAGQVLSVEQTEKTTKEYDRMIAAELKDRLKEAAKAAKKAARKAK